MKLRHISLTIATMLATQIAFAQTKTLDFYSSSGSNRYSISGKVKDLNIPINQNGILIPDANNEAYVKLNNQAPYHLRFIESDLSLYQIIEFNKGKEIQVEGKTYKLIGAQNDKIIADDGSNVVFIPFDKVQIPKTFLMDTQKGLKATFSKDVSGDDVLYFSQPERQLRYNNSYESVLIGDKIHLIHFLNITNSSLTTFKNVYLNFFLSETNIQSHDFPMMRSASKAVMGEIAIVNSAPSTPTFENQDVQNLKTISIKEPMNIYPNFNKIKYLDKKYPVEQYATVELDDKYEIYLGDEITEKDKPKDLKELMNKDTTLNNIYIERLNALKNQIKNSGEHFRNIIEIKVDKEDTLPQGKLDIYEGVKGQDKLIVSTNMNHTENSPLKVFKSKNNDLKIVNVDLEEVKNTQANRHFQKNKLVTFKLNSIEVENVGKTDYVVNLFNKKITVKPGVKVKISS